MKNIKNTIKENIVQNFMEAAKFARRGVEKQRPKSWSKGTKSGSDKRKMREEGKHQAREMNEAAEAFDPKSLDAASKRPFVIIGHGDDAKKVTASEYYAHLISQKIPHAMAVEHTKLSFGMDDGSSRMRNRSSGDYVNLRDPNTGRQTRIAGHDAHDARRDEFYESAQHNSQDVSETYYNKLKENTEIPRHARVTGKEVYGNMDPHAEDRKALHGDQYDPEHEKHYQDFMKTLKTTKDQNHAKLLVTRGAIAAALGRASMSKYTDPTSSLKRVESILSASQRALDDHFKLTQQSGNIPF